MQKVLILDSGSGGINVLLECLKICPSFDFLIFIDEENMPYGNKSPQELMGISQKLIEKIDEFFCSEIVILACNTLTAVAIDFLREKFPQKIFIGSQPAIIPALKKFEKEELCILATAVTVQNCPILKDFQNICKTPKNLPKVIDENLFERENLLEYLKKNLDLKGKKGVVLGCTHFEGIKNEIQNLFPNIQTFSSGRGIAKYLSTFCKKENAFQVQFLTNGENRAKFLHYFKQKFKSH